MADNWPKVSALHTELVHIAADVTRGKYLLNLEGCKTIRHVLHRQATQEDRLRLALVERLNKLLEKLAALATAQPKPSASPWTLEDAPEREMSRD